MPSLQQDSTRNQNSPPPHPAEAESNGTACKAAWPFCPHTRLRTAARHTRPRPSLPGHSCKRSTSTPSQGRGRTDPSPGAPRPGGDPQRRRAPSGPGLRTRHVSRENRPAAQPGPGVTGPGKVTTPLPPSAMGCSTGARPQPEPPGIPAGDTRCSRPLRRTPPGVAAPAPRRLPAAPAESRAPLPRGGQIRHPALSLPGRGRVDAGIPRLRRPRPPAPYRPNQQQDGGPREGGDSTACRHSNRAGQSPPPRE